MKNLLKQLNEFEKTVAGQFVKIQADQQLNLYLQTVLFRQLVLNRTSSSDSAQMTVNALRRELIDHLKNIGDESHASGFRDATINAANSFFDKLEIDVISSYPAKQV